MTLPRGRILHGALGLLTFAAVAAGTGWVAFIPWVMALVLETTITTWRESDVSKGPQRLPLALLVQHRFGYAARVRRNVVDGELLSVSLELMRDGDVAELVEGDEFITLLTKVDPFADPKAHPDTP